MKFLKHLYLLGCISVSHPSRVVFKIYVKHFRLRRYQHFVAFKQRILNRILYITIEATQIRCPKLRLSVF